MKAKFVDIALQYKVFQGPYRSILKPKHFSALKQLRNNADIVVLKPNAVLMDIADYNDKMLHILSDNKNFIPLDSPQDNT